MIRTRRVSRIVLGVMVVMAAVIIAQEKMFYRNRRPTRAGRSLNGCWARAYGSGLLPSWLVSLETVGRRSGQRRANALVRADYEGQQYLVSMLGEKSEWVRNARAREGAATIRHGQRTTIRLEEVPVDERAPILKAYLSRARGARRHFTVRHDAPVEAFNAVANEYPVFRIVPGSPTPEPPAVTAETVASR